MEFSLSYLHCFEEKILQTLVPSRLTDNTKLLPNANIHNLYTSDLSIVVGKIWTLL